MNNITKHLQEDIFKVRATTIARKIELGMKAKDWDIKDLAKATGKKPKKVEKWLSGGHNFTFKRIGKLEAVLEKSLLKK